MTSLRDLALGARVLLAVPIAVLSWTLQAAAHATGRLTRIVLRGDLR